MASVYTILTCHDPGIQEERAPIQGEEFTQRLLTPFQEQKLTLLLRQGYDVDSLLRLMGAEIRLETNEHSLAPHTTP